MENIYMTKGNFTVKDTQKIIKRALELQQVDTGSENISIEELVEIGTDIGIESSYIQDAARELEISGDSKSVFGTSVNVSESFYLETFIDNEKLKELMVFLPDITEKKGSGSIIRGKLSWSSDEDSDPLDSINVRVLRRNNRTEIKLSKDLRKLAVALYVGLGIGGGVGIGVGIGVGVGIPLGMTLFSILFPIGSICTAGVLAGHLYKRIVKQKRIQLIKLADEIKKEIAASSTE